ncbi:PREDICTED: larval serum protein 1 alpha chain-like [Nicrophorus vespilloides]|uniref:Larval serum protein 1 alpha chain-like n=1 Tax=Nicrophorus vespilloides TaxID=110193 RepID=A0ABM1MRF8_NICVS|nr:PREDICTED: larval serum protein 1 alpha chain-like [Nicrophorus vespilloides]
MSGVHYKVADKVFLEKQKDILRLFQHVQQPTYYKDLIEFAKTFKFEGHWDQWSKPEYVKEFWQFYQEQDFLKQDEIFSVFHPMHTKYAKALFRVFYYAKDFVTFYKSAAWARQHVNTGLFVYVLSVAVVHSKHTKEVILPPIYEIFPHYFFTSEVITKAKQYKQHYWGTYKHELEHKEKSSYTIPAEYTKYEEEWMTYFTEDIGMNAHYYYRSVFLPYWLEQEYISFDATKRSEWCHYYHSQIVARYYLERLSNGKGKIPTINFEEPTQFEYHPALTYFNGKPFPCRPKNVKFDLDSEEMHNSFKEFSHCLTKVEDYEKRIRDALDLGWVYTPEGKMIDLYTKEGFETLGKIIECNPESSHARFYGNLQIFLRHLIGFSQNTLTPSVLEHYETSLRDPMFYQIAKRILRLFNTHQHHMGPYEKHHLLMEGIKVEDMHVDQLVTFFEQCFTDISNAVTVDEKEFAQNSFEVYARQFRLNHKPYNYKIQVSSDKSVDALVKVFIGPKYDEFGHEIEMKHNYMNFFELDRFKYTLKSGKNVIERNSHENKFFNNEHLTFKTLFNQVHKALNGEESFKMQYPAEYYNFPQRMMLPRGDASGKTFQFFVVVTKYEAPTSDAFSEWLVDTHHSMCYPLDRPIKFEEEFWVPNFFAKDVKIYHEKHHDEEKLMYKQH